MKKVVDNYYNNFPEMKELIDYVQKNLPKTLRSKYKAFQIDFIYNAVEDYFSETGIFDEEDNGPLYYRTIDVAEFVAQRAREDKYGTFPIKDLVVLVDLIIKFASFEVEVDLSDWDKRILGN